MKKAPKTPVSAPTKESSAKRIGIIGLFAVLAASGTFFLTPEELDQTYVCEPGGMLAIFPDGPPDGGCTNEIIGVRGEWLRCDDYASRHGFASCRDVFLAKANDDQNPVVRRIEIIDGTTRTFAKCVEE